MLYNPDWKKPQNPLTLEAVADWLETKNPNGVYDYFDPMNCLARQYCDHIGLKYEVGGGSLLQRLFTRTGRFLYKLENIAEGRVIDNWLCNGQQTYGGALVRVNAKLGR